jgi:hypothetical protein
MLWCELGIRLLVYQRGSLTLVQAAQTADGDLKCKPPVLHLELIPGLGAIPWTQFVALLKWRFISVEFNPLEAWNNFLNIWIKPILTTTLTGEDVGTCLIIMGSYICINPLICTVYLICNMYYGTGVSQCVLSRYEMLLKFHFFKWVFTIINYNCCLLSSAPIFL